MFAERALDSVLNKMSIAGYPINQNSLEGELTFVLVREFILGSLPKNITGYLQTEYKSNQNFKRLVDSYRRERSQYNF